MFSTQPPGDGNCFYHAVVECLKHKSRPININHTDLRNSVVDYVRCNRISEFLTTWRLQQNINCDLDFVFEKQRHEGEYANELFIRGTSLFLDIAILFTRSTSTPYDVFWPMQPVPSNQSMKNYTGEYILIGYNVNHFQSLYFVSKPPWQSSSMPSSHFGFDKARLHDTSEIPNKRMKLNNMTKNNTFDSVLSILSSKENKSKDIRTNKVENELRQQCLQYRVQYVDREKDESRYKCRKRRKLMRENIQNAHASSTIIKNMESNGDDVDFVVEFLDMEGNSFRVPFMADQNEINMNESSFLQEGNSFHAPSMTDQNEINMNESYFLHANTEVHKMVQMFNDGELNHSVATCLTCHETRPQFHATKPSEKFHTENRKPHEVPSWVINKGRCKRCHKEYLTIKSLITYLPFQVNILIQMFVIFLHIITCTLGRYHHFYQI